ncbi:MAG TPA: hypothetical protein VF208_12850, partial [Candidatus Binatia bacterium]
MSMWLIPMLLNQAMRFLPMVAMTDWDFFTYFAGKSRRTDVLISRPSCLVRKYMCRYDLGNEL